MSLFAGSIEALQTVLRLFGYLTGCAWHTLSAMPDMFATEPPQMGGLMGDAYTHRETHTRISSCVRIRIIWGPAIRSIADIAKGDHDSQLPLHSKSIPRSVTIQMQAAHQTSFQFTITWEPPHALERITAAADEPAAHCSLCDAVPTRHEKKYSGRPSDFTSHVADIDPPASSVHVFPQGMPPMSGKQPQQQQQQQPPPPDQAEQHHPHQARRDTGSVPLKLGGGEPGCVQDTALPFGLREAEDPKRLGGHCRDTSSALSLQWDQSTASRGALRDAVCRRPADRSRQPHGWQLTCADCRPDTRQSNAAHP